MAVGVVCFKLFLLAVCVSLTRGIRLPGCTYNRIGLDETASGVSITCDEFEANDTVTWALQSEQNFVNLGTCPPTSERDCIISGQFGITRSADASTVEIPQSTILRREIGSYGISCSVQGNVSLIDTCDLEVFYPSEASCTLTPTSGTWTIDGLCNVRKTFSSRNSYSCQVYRRHSQTSQTSLVSSVTFTTSPHGEPGYQKGACSLSFTLENFSSTSDIYEIIIHPGSTSVIIPIKIEKPASPTLFCPPVIAENTAFQCVCNTSNIGLPGGRLRLTQVKGSLETVGDYDVTSVTLSPPPLQPDDNGVTQFRCDVEWATGGYTDVYTVSVGYPPSRVDMTVSNSTSGSVIVAEKDAIPFVCVASGGNPNPTVALWKAGSRLAEGATVVVFNIPSAHCEQAGVYTCTADNGFGSSLVVNTTLYVECAPRGTGFVGEIRLGNRQQSLNFEVIAYPKPHSLSFVMVESDEKEQTAQDANVTGIAGSCVQSESFLFKSTCNITVSGKEAAGMYLVSVTNTRGSGVFNFRLADTEIQRSISSSYIPVVVGVCVSSVVAVSVVVTSVYLYRRRLSKPKKDSGVVPDSDTNRSQGSTSESTSESRGPYDSLQVSDIGLRSVYSTVGQRGNVALTSEPQAGPYEHLQMSDVGLRSDYSSVGQAGDRGAFSTPLGQDTAPTQTGVYEELNSADIGVKSVYTNLKQKH